MYSRFPIRFHVYSNSSKFPGVECLGTVSKFGKREQNSSWLVYFLQTTPHIKEISRGVRAGRAKKCIKKGCCTCKLLAMRPIAFLTFYLPSPSSLVKLVRKPYGTGLLRRITLSSLDLSMCVNGWESEYDFSTNACESRPNTLNVINPEKSSLV